VQSGSESEMLYLHAVMLDLFSHEVSKTWLCWVFVGWKKAIWSDCAFYSSSQQRSQNWAEIFWVETHLCWTACWRQKTDARSQRL